MAVTKNKNMDVFSGVMNVLTGEIYNNLKEFMTKSQY